MLKSQIPVRSSVLNDAEPLTAEEIRSLMEEWANRNLDALLAYADQEPNFAKRLCMKVADKYVQDDSLSALLLKRLRDGRQGKPRARRKTWNWARYFVLLTHYKMLLGFGMKRVDVLAQLADMEKISGVNKAKKIEERITRAKKQVKTCTISDST